MIWAMCVGAVCVLALLFAGLMIALQYVIEDKVKRQAQEAFHGPSCGCIDCDPPPETHVDFYL